MTEITVTATAEDAASKSLHVSVPVDRVQAAEARALREYGRRAKLPGFRAGKAPDAVVRKRFGQAIRQYVIEEVIREGWEQARTADDLKPISDPTVRNLKFEDGQPVEFDFQVDVRPSIELTRLGGFTVTREMAPVTDEMVSEQIEQLRESRAAWIPVADEAPAPGNMVRVEVTSIEDGELKDPQSYSVVVGQGQAVPALEEKIMELKPGETAEADIKLPDDHPDPTRRGQHRKVRVSLLEVKRQELPPVDDGFAKEVGDFEDLAALRAGVRTDLERNAAREADAGVREAVLNQVIEANGVEAPPSLVNRALHAYLHAYEVPHEREEQFYTEFRPVAVNHVKRELVVGAVAEREKLFATEADLDGRIAKIAEGRGVSPNEVYASFEKNKRLPELERSITEEKVFEFLLQQSTVEEKSA
jgi:trigger factor